MAVHHDLKAEQAFVDHAYARLPAMREAATSMLKDAFGERGSGTPQSVTDRDVSVRTSLARIDQLADRRRAPHLRSHRHRRRPRTTRRGFHIGRLAVADEDQEPLVVDWRAPVAEPFYRATGRHPLGLAPPPPLPHRGPAHHRHRGRAGSAATGPTAGLGVGGSTRRC